MVERVSRGGGKGVSQSSAVLILSVNDWRTFRGRESSPAAAATGFSLTVVRHGDGEGDMGGLLMRALVSMSPEVLAVGFFTRPSHRSVGTRYFLV